MPRQISSDTSLEQLKKDAKRWLKALRAGDASARARLELANPRAGNPPALRDVQHALAREYGCDGWIALARAVESARAGRAPEAVDYEPLAADFVRALEERNEAALARLNAHYGRAFTFDDLGAEIWRRIYAFRQRSSHPGGAHLRPDEARALVAQDAGFASWEALTAPAHERPERAPAFAVDAAASSIGAMRQLTGADWDRLLDEIAAGRVSTLESNGVMTDAVLARLADQDRLAGLDLSGSRQVTDAGIAHLARMTNLRRLNLTGTNVTDRGLAVLRDLPQLRAFEMTWTRGLSDAGAAHLAACDRIESVNLMGSATGDGVIAALAGKPALRRLHTGRLVTDAGVHALVRIPTLARRDPAAPFHLLVDGPITDAGAGVLAQLEGLADLNLFWNVTGITPAAFASFARLPHLHGLGADGALSGDEAMRHIGALPHLRRLRAQDSTATDAGWEALARSTTLQELWGRDAQHFGSRGFRALSRMPALRSLGMPCDRVDDAALAALGDFPALSALTAIGFTDAGFRHVGRCERLERLSCMYCRDTTDAATEHIASLSLTSYYAGLTQITDRSLEILGRMTSLEEIELYECLQVTDAGVAQLAALPKLREARCSGMPHVTFAGMRVLPKRVQVRYAT
jgi:hypothetical protein